MWQRWDKQISTEIKQEIKKNWTGDNKSTQGEQTGRVTQMKLKEKNENNSYE